MIGVHIDIMKDTATPTMRAIGRAIRPAALNPVVGRAGANLFREKLFEANRTKPNALGGTRTEFYAAAARGTHFDILPDGVLISVNQVGIRQRVVGGTIKPTGDRKFLTIPARAEAHGKRASEFNDLVIVFGKGGQPVALARASQTLITHRRDKTTGALIGATKRAEAGGEILFWLVKSVTQRGDDTIMPTKDQLGAAISKAIASHVQRAADRASGATGGTN